MKLDRQKEYFLLDVVYSLPGENMQQIVSFVVMKYSCRWQHSTLYFLHNESPSDLSIVMEPNESVLFFRVCFIAQEMTAPVQWRETNMLLNIFIHV